MTGASVTVTVYKLGGSLLDWPEFPQRLRRLWSDRPAGERRLLIVGGGRAADLVREWDRQYQLGEERSHDLALDALQFNTALVARLFPEAVTIESAAAVDRLAAGQLGLVSAGTFLTREETPDRPIPRSWEFTTDSIAAWIGGRVVAEELILLKSAPLPPASTIPDLVAAGMLDGEFPRWAGEFARNGGGRIAWCNLRGDGELASLDAGP